MGYDLYAVASDVQPDYFRANIWGMQILRGAMHHANVLDDDAEHPAFPKIERGDNEADEDYDLRVKDAYSPILSAGSTSHGLVPTYKFCSNDGWVVTAEECKFIANALNVWLDNRLSDGKNDEDDPFISEFADFCDIHAQHEGFSVW